MVDIQYLGTSKINHFASGSEQTNKLFVTVSLYITLENAP